MELCRRGAGCANGESGEWVFKDSGLYSRTAHAGRAALEAAHFVVIE